MINDYNYLCQPQTSRKFDPGYIQVYSDHLTSLLGTVTMASQKMKMRDEMVDSVDIEGGTVSVSFRPDGNQVESRLTCSIQDGSTLIEKALVRKQDLRIVPLSAFIYLLCYLDRSNIGRQSFSHSEVLGHH